MKLDELVSVDGEYSLILVQCGEASSIGAWECIDDMMHAFTGYTSVADETQMVDIGGNINNNQFTAKMLEEGKLSPATIAYDMVDDGSTSAYAKNSLSNKDIIDILNDPDSKILFIAA